MFNVLTITSGEDIGKLFVQVFIFQTTQTFCLEFTFWFPTFCWLCWHCFLVVDCQRGDITCTYQASYRAEYDDVVKRLANNQVQVLDSRPVHVFAKGHLPGAINIPFAPELLNGSVTEMKSVEELKKGKLPVSWLLSFNNQYIMILQYSSIQSYPLVSSE